jgi:hypothetical protein
MVFTRSFLAVQREEKVSGIVYNLGEYPPIKINFLSFMFELREVKYFADVRYRCPVNNATRHVRVELSRNRFILLNRDENITIKLRVCREYVYGISSFQFSIPVGIE